VVHKELGLQGQPLEGLVIHDLPDLVALPLDDPEPRVGFQVAARVEEGLEVGDVTVRQLLLEPLGGLGEQRDPSQRPAP
jgi:hypothetical protein